MIRRLPIALVLMLAIAAIARADDPRPRFEFTSSDSYSAASVPPYRGTHDAIYRYIDRNLSSHTAQLQRWVRQRSISTQNDGIIPMAEMLRDDLLALGFKEAELVPTTGHPGVFGYYDAGAKNTLVVYMMYDVQPVEPEAWRVPPFDGAIVDHELGKVLMARGATNQKGPQRAFLNALEAIRSVTGNLPVNLLVVAEGEEELGSPHYPEVIDRYEARLRRADGVIFPMNSQNPAGAVSVFLGVKGIVYFELEATGGEKGGPSTAEIHGSYKAIADAPAWRLVQALASLTSKDGNTIAVKGYYDPIRPPNAEEQRLANGMLEEWDRSEPKLRQAFGISRWVDGMTGRDSLHRLLFDTTLNIDGIWGGYTGEGVKTILPHKATAKLDSRLVPDQTPDQALALIRKHLDDNGLSDIVLRKLSGYPPAQTSVEAPLVRAGLSAYRKYAPSLSVAPRIAGSAPYYVFTDRLKLPMLAVGLGHGSGAHAPNEYMVMEPKSGSAVAGLATAEKFYVDMLYALATTK